MKQDDLADKEILKRLATLALYGHVTALPDGRFAERRAA
jgi:hypothetical protein